MHFVDDLRLGVGKVAHGGSIAAGKPCPGAGIGLMVVSDPLHPQNFKGGGLTVPSTKIYWLVAPAALTPSIQAWLSSGTVVAVGSS